MIYLVDDNDDLRIALEDFIVTLGYEVRSYAAAEPALADFEANREELSLLITDVLLPGQDGYALARRIRRAVPGLPVIAISGHARRPPDDAGVDVIRKPVPLAKLAARIAACQPSPD